MGKKGGGDVFSRHPIKQDRGTYKITPNGGAKAAVAGNVGRAKKPTKGPNGNGPAHRGSVVGPAIPIPPKASKQSINKLPSGGKTNIA